MAALAIKDIPQAYQKALALHASGENVQAHALLNEIIAVRPRTAEAHFQIGRIAREARDYPTAIRALDNAREIKPGEAAILRELAGALGEAARTAEAIEVYEALLAAKPGDAETILQLGILEQRRGNFEKSDKHFRKVLRASPGNGMVYRVWLQARKMKRGEPLLREMLKVHAEGKTAGMSRAHLCFALSKAMEEIGEPQKVFRFLNEANRLVATELPYDPAAYDAEIDETLASLEALDYSDLTQASDNASFAPILVTGLPRSGTTLVEQILASHSLVTGGDELAILAPLLTRLLRGKGGGTTMQPATIVTPDQYAAFPGAYEREIRKRVAFDQHVTDKSITNFRFLGLIKKLVPNVRIILVRRDPRDQLLSMYRNVFPEGSHAQSYDMQSLAHYYKGFTRYVDFWRERCPGIITEVVYEDLVNDPEVQARRIVEGAGLEWEDACLAFHETKRDVRTLSIHQVRQPLYKSSTAAWEKYADDLKPMIDALEENGSLEWHYKT